MYNWPSSIFMYKHTLVQPKNAQTTRIDIYQSNTLNTQFLGHVGTLVTATRNLRIFYSRVLVMIVGSAGLRGAQSLCQLRQRAPKKQGVALSSGPWQRRQWGEVLYTYPILNAESIYQQLLVLLVPVVSQLPRFRLVEFLLLTLQDYSIL